MKKIVEYSILTSSLIIVFIAAFIFTISKINSCTDKKQLQKLETKTEVVNKQVLIDSVVRAQQLVTASKLDSQARVLEMQSKANKTAISKAISNFHEAAKKDTSDDCKEIKATANKAISLLQADNLKKDSALILRDSASVIKDTVIRRLTIDLSTVTKNRDEWKKQAEKPCPKVIFKGVAVGVTITGVLIAVAKIFIFK